PPASATRRRAARRLDGVHDAARRTRGLTLRELRLRRVRRARRSTRVGEHPRAEERLPELVETVGTLAHELVGDEGLQRPLHARNGWKVVREPVSVAERPARFHREGL